MKKIIQNKKSFIQKLQNFFTDKNNPKKFSRSKFIIGFIIFTTIVIFSLILQYTILKKIGDIIAIITQIFVYFFTFIIFIQLYTDRKYDYKDMIWFGICINLFFILGTIVFINYNCKILFFSFFIYLCLIIIICKILKKYNNINYSPLKGTNYIFVTFFTAIIYFLQCLIDKGCIISCIDKDSLNFIWLCYVIPLMGLQGLYELLDGKKNYIENHDFSSKDTNSIRSIEMNEYECLNNMRIFFSTFSKVEKIKKIHFLCKKICDTIILKNILSTITTLENEAIGACEHRCNLLFSDLFDNVNNKYSEPPYKTIEAHDVSILENGFIAYPSKRETLSKLFDSFDKNDFKWKNDINHSIILIKPFNIYFVVNGNNSIACAKYFDKQGYINCDQAIDYSDLLIKFNFNELVNKNNNVFFDEIKHLFLLGRLLIEENANGEQEK